MTAAPRRFPALPADGEPHYYTYLGLWWEQRDDHIAGGATVSPFLCAPGTAMPRAAMLAAYADAVSGLDASASLGAIVPTLDLSVHVFRTPTVADFTLESRDLKVGRRVAVGETWFTAAGEPDPYAVAVATFMRVGERDPEGVTLPSSVAPPFAPGALLREPIERVGGIATVAPGVTRIDHRPAVSNSLGTVQGGMVALLAELACESLLAAERGPHVVTGLDVRFLSTMRVGPLEAKARLLRGDPASSQLWVEVRDIGDDDRLVVHTIASAAPADAFAARGARPDP